MKHTDPIVFVASVEKVGTLSKGGIRLTLDFPETAIAQMARLTDVKVRGLALWITALPISEEEYGKTDGKGPVRTGVQWEPGGTPTGEAGTDEIIGDSGGEGDYFEATWLEGGDQGSEERGPVGVGVGIDLEWARGPNGRDEAETTGTRVG